MERVMPIAHQQTTLAPARSVDARVWPFITIVFFSWEAWLFSSALFFAFFPVGTGDKEWEDKEVQKRRGYSRQVLSKSGELRRILRWGRIEMGCR